MDNLLQANQDLQHLIGQDLPLHQTSTKPERMTEGHMKQEKNQVITYSRLWNRVDVVAMEPLSIDHNFYLD
jgi:hypothetical protein